MVITLFLFLVVLLGVIVLLSCALYHAVGLNRRGEAAEAPCPCEDCEAGDDEWMAVADAVAEPTEADREREYIADVLDDAHAALVSFFAADSLGVDGEGCQVWMDRAWDRLRELDDEQRIRAALMLLAADAQEDAKELSDVEGALR